jgi:hypothetical protein
MCINTCLLHLINVTYCKFAMESALSLLKNVVVRLRSKGLLELQDYLSDEVDDYIDEVLFDLEYAVRRIEVFDAKFRKLQAEDMEILEQHRQLQAHCDELERRLQRGIQVLSNPEPTSDQNSEQSDDEK